MLTALSRLRTLTGLTLLLALLTGALVSGATVSASAAKNPYQRGPAPTWESLAAATGSYATTSAKVPAGNGFGGGTVYYPTSTADGTFGGVVIAPGFTLDAGSIAWLGPRLASRGFVVMTISTNTPFDQPGSRADQLASALTYLTTSSAARTRVDPKRLAVMGHSMGGGGTIEAANDDTTLKAAVSMTPWHTQKTWSAVRTPTLVIGAQNDAIASTSGHAKPLYQGISTQAPKAYLELKGADHFAPTYLGSTTLAQYSIAWLKRWVDDDKRYTTFVTTGLATGPNVSAVQRSGY